jgi:hypothetical protein
MNTQRLLGHRDGRALNIDTDTPRRTKSSVIHKNDDCTNGSCIFIYNDGIL